MDYDIEISGSVGFYSIRAASDSGTDWLADNLDDLFNGFCDDTSMTQDIADGAHDDGLIVLVNGHKYIGHGMVAA